jgi:transcriptional regulator with XRE-family HTH domain
MKFYPERLTQLRESLNISKAEAARRLNISAMTYGRYEKGEREPSYQSVCYIAQVFHCNVDFLYGVSDDMDCDYIIISSTKFPKETVKFRFSKLDISHIEYVLECMNHNTTNIKNIKKYLLAALYNAPTTIDSYYKARVQHDMPELAN